MAHGDLMLAAISGRRGMRAGAGIARRYLVVGLPEHAGYALSGLAGNPGIGLPGRVVAVKGLKSAMAAATAPPWPT